MGRGKGQTRAEKSPSLPKCPLIKKDWRGTLMKIDTLQ
jgi:hypothetical protein